MPAVVRPFFGPHPEFPLVVAGKEGFVFLRFVFEDGQFLPQHDLGTQRDGPFDFVRLVFLPGASVEPDFGTCSPRASPLQGP